MKYDFKTKKAAVAKHSARSTDLKTELDSYIRLCQHARECLENSFFSGMGYKQEGLSKDDVSALSALSIAMERAISARIKYDKHTKSFAEQMTPEEEREAIEEYILAMVPTERIKFIRKVVSRHNKLNSGPGIEYNPTLSGDENVSEDSDS